MVMHYCYNSSSEHLVMMKPHVFSIVFTCLLYNNVRQVFLRHKIIYQVLLNDNEDLSNFRSQSVKKKPLENKIVSTLNFFRDIKANAKK